VAMRVGILAIQGDVDAHARAVESLGALPFPVLGGKDLDAADCLILPGGESTTVSKALQRLHLYEPIDAEGYLPLVTIDFTPELGVDPSSP
jgi:5'-phosphate synthase pdxT subunit